MAPIEFHPSSKNTDDDEDIRRVRKRTYEVDVIFRTSKGVYVEVT